ncbi:MAG TPA: hypothetical protein VEL05_03270, partial [Candidatus Acidoferrum sp.]|nr:hypothetical protein [Candidatus Acidoferrum sp.]
RTNRLLRLLVPSAHPLASIVTSSIVADDRHTVVIARSFAGAFRADLGDSFRVNGTEVLNQEIANAGTATVGLFLFDDNLNGASDGGSVAAYSQLPFIRATDVFMDASAPAFIDLTFDGTTVRVPNWPSVSEGPTFVVFP